MSVYSDLFVGPDPVPASSATQSAYFTLRNLIVTGALRPGEKLKIGALCERLNIGASPIREALSLLTSDNLVERIDQRGFRASPTNLRNFKEILSLRCELEDMALRQSVENRTDAWEEELVLCHHRMRREQEKTGNDFETLHKAFHMAILSNCGGPILFKFCSQLYDLNIRYRYLAGNAVDYQSRDTAAEHKAILDILLAGDADAASDCLLDHYRKTGAFLSRVLEGMGVP